MKGGQDRDRSPDDYVPLRRDNSPVVEQGLIYSGQPLSPRRGNTNGESTERGGEENGNGEDRFKHQRERDRRERDSSFDRGNRDGREEDRKDERREKGGDKEGRGERGERGRGRGRGGGRGRGDDSRPAPAVIPGKYPADITLNSTAAVLDIAATLAGILRKSQVVSIKASEDVALSVGVRALCVARQFMKSNGVKFHCLVDRNHEDYYIRAFVEGQVIRPPPRQDISKVEISGHSPQPLARELASFARSRKDVIVRCTNSDATALVMRALTIARSYVRSNNLDLSFRVEYLYEERTIPNNQRQAYDLVIHSHTYNECERLPWNAEQSRAGPVASSRSSRGGPPSSRGGPSRRDGPSSRAPPAGGLPTHTGLPHAMAYGIMPHGIAIHGHPSMYVGGGRDRDETRRRTRSDSRDRRRSPTRSLSPRSRSPRQARRDRSRSYERDRARGGSRGRGGRDFRGGSRDNAPVPSYPGTHAQQYPMMHIPYFVGYPTADGGRGGHPPMMPQYGSIAPSGAAHFLPPYAAAPPRGGFPAGPVGGSLTVPVSRTNPREIDRAGYRGEGETADRDRFGATRRRRSKSRSQSPPRGGYHRSLSPPRSGLPSGVRVVGASYSDASRSRSPGPRRD